MVTLEHISIRGYKSIRQADVPLRPLNVLIGSNGAGKSNFISAFRLLNRVAEKGLQLAVGKSGGADSILYHGRKKTHELVFELRWSNSNGYACSLVPATDGSLVFADEACSYRPKQFGRAQPYTVDLGGGHRETKVPEEANRNPGKVADYVLARLRSWRIYHFHDTSVSAGVKQLGDLNDNRALRDDASNLAAFLFLLRETDPDRYDLIVRTVRLVAPFFGDFILRPSPFNENKIRLEWREIDSDSYFGADDFSDGTLRFICLSTLLLQPTAYLPTTILIDEPELGLHPYAIVLLSGLLKQASARVQVIVATQSVPLVDQLEPSDLIVVDREDGQSVFSRPEAGALEEWLEDFSLGELWQKNVLGGRTGPSGLTAGRE